MLRTTDLGDCSSSPRSKVFMYHLTILKHDLRNVFENQIISIRINKNGCSERTKRETEKQRVL